jgi:hypothetical protein
MSTSPPTTLTPTTVVPDTDIYCDPFEATGQIVCYFSYSPVHGRDPSLDIWRNVDPLEATGELLGELLTTSIDAGIFEATGELLGGLVVGQSIEVAIFEVDGSLTGVMIVENKLCNWIAWSVVGSLDFDINRSNEAGKRQLDWKGCVYEIIKLVDRVVVYGENGVSVLSPKGNVYGLETIHRIGIVNKSSIIGTDMEHFFIDKTYKMYKLTVNGLELLDYSEYLSTLGNIKMSMDLENRILFICDGVNGFVYGIDSKSFGIGPKNVTGFGTQSGSLYISAPDEIEIPKFEIRTDVYDLGTRKHKTIQFLEVGTDLTNRMRVMIETRVMNSGPFLQSEWALVNPSGIAVIPCYGLEFKFHLASYIKEYIKLDYLKVSGVIHGANYLDFVSRA